MTSPSTRRAKKTDKPADAAAAERGSERLRMNPEDRRRQILEYAAEYFAEHGLTGQTRGLAAACGISQRLLYRYFPTKEALIDEVYRLAILGPFKAVWFAELADRKTPLESRLIRFYSDYFATIFSRKWLRLFMHASLVGVDMAPNYTSSMLLQLLEIIVAEAGHEQAVDIPSDKNLQHIIGWTLHGALSHYAIRRHLYDFPQPVPEDAVVAIQVAQFLGGFRAAVKAAG